MAKVDKTDDTAEVKSALMSQDIGYIKSSLDALSKKMDGLTGQFITRVEFMPVRSLVYGLVTLILIAVVGAILALVIKQ